MIADPEERVVCPGCKITFASHQYLEKHFLAEQGCKQIFYRRKPSIEKRKRGANDGNTQNMRAATLENIAEVLAQNKALAKRSKALEK